jgi:predicted DNA-binding protein
MARMVRKQIYMDEELEARLKRRARLFGMTESEVIRRGLDAFLNGRGDETLEADIERLDRMWAESDRRGVGSDGRKWTREEIHERPGRSGH